MRKASRLYTGKSLAAPIHTCTISGLENTSCSKCIFYSIEFGIDTLDPFQEVL